MCIELVCCCCCCSTVVHTIFMWQTQHSIHSIPSLSDRNNTLHIQSIAVCWSHWFSKNKREITTIFVWVRVNVVFYRKRSKLFRSYELQRRYLFLCTIFFLSVLVSAYFVFFVFDFCRKEWKKKTEEIVKKIKNDFSLDFVFNNISLWKINRLLVFLFVCSIYNFSWCDEILLLKRKKKLIV